MEFISYLVLIVVLLIYLKLAIDYHPKWLNFFKEEKNTISNRTTVWFHFVLMKRKYATTYVEDLGVDEDGMSKSFSIDVFVYSEIFDGQINEKQQIKEKLLQMYVEIEDEYKSYKNFCTGTIYFRNDSDKFIRQNLEEAKYIGSGRLSGGTRNNLLMTLKCPNEAYEKIFQKVKETEKLGLRIECEVEIKNDYELTLLAKSFYLENDLEFNETMPVINWKNERSRNTIKRFENVERQMTRYIREQKIVIED